MAAGGAGGAAAAGLREEQRYGLSCGRLGQDHITVLHVYKQGWRSIEWEEKTPPAIHRFVYCFQDKV